MDLLSCLVVVEQLSVLNRQRLILSFVCRADIDRNSRLTRRAQNSSMWATLSATQNLLTSPANCWRHKRHGGQKLLNDRTVTTLSTAMTFHRWS